MNETKLSRVLNSMSDSAGTACFMVRRIGRIACSNLVESISTHPYPSNQVSSSQIVKPYLAALRGSWQLTPFIVAICVGGLGVSPALAEPSQVYPRADTYLGEMVGPTEVADALELAENLRAKVREQYVRGLARRDAHPKAHGCVRASFEVLSDLPVELQVGLFRPGATYDAVIRFSNGSPNAAGDDRNGDTRGMATKLYGVPGEKFFEDPGAADAHDFIQISSPIFFVNDSRGYTDFFERVNSGKTLELLKIPLILGWTGSVNAARMLSQKITNPLAVTYYSVTPYQFGTGNARQAVKYSATPCAGQHTFGSDQAQQDGPNFLRHEMQAKLEQNGVCFDFRIQRRPDDSYSVEDVITEWDEAAAPFVPVAQIIIPPQTFDTPALNAACEALTFNPWHAIGEHKPLGAINRMRRVVYEAISDLRYEMNDTAPAILRGEP